MEYLVFARISEGGIHLMAKAILLMSARKPLPCPKKGRFPPKMLSDTIAGRWARLIKPDTSLQAGRQLAANDNHANVTRYRRQIHCHTGMIGCSRLSSSPFCHVEVSRGVEGKVGLQERRCFRHRDPHISQLLQLGS
jgi:hypothetical protein